MLVSYSDIVVWGEDWLIGKDGKAQRTLDGPGFASKNSSSGCSTKSTRARFASGSGPDGGGGRPPDGGGGGPPPPGPPIGGGGLGAPGGAIIIGGRGGNNPGGGGP